ncbi:MAG: DUF1343 domain-containing protein [Candidatus Hydrogenedentota bacterium]|nr:MAG: DUF1343 domain-containing protein [Candidatus Hydrogenedentota bacterium]
MAVQIHKTKKFLGLEAFADIAPALIKNQSYAILTHPAAVDFCFRHSTTIIEKVLGYPPKAYFAPQHGWYASTQDNMIEWEGQEQNPVPIYSLYSNVRKPTAKMLEGIQWMIVDLVDVGCRVYTFIQTLKLVMDACCDHNINILVLDRPNPNGQKQEGPLLQPGYESFVGLTNIPLLHGMSIGEIAAFYAETISVNLHVISIHKKAKKKPRIPWVMPSPNMPTLETARVYAGSVLFEGTTISEGRGTTRPFELIASPKTNSKKLSEWLNSLNLPDVIFRECAFEPTFHKFRGQLCYGVQIHPTGKNFRPVLTGIALLLGFSRYSKDFAWKNPPYEYETQKMPIDIISGSSQLREWIEKGKPLEEFQKWIDQEIKLFRNPIQ